MSAMIQFPLDRPDVEILKTELTAQGQLVITVESTLEGTRCRRCGQEIREPYGHDRPLRLRHLPVLDRPDNNRDPSQALPLPLLQRPSHHDASRS